MNKDLYKSSLKNITVSDNIMKELERKASAYMTADSRRKKKMPKLLLPAAVLLAISIITVSAAPALGLDTAFRGFFSQFFGSEMTGSQLGIIEKYGYAPNKSFKKDGVELSVDGVIGDRSLLYVKYSVLMKKGYDPDTYSGIMTNKLYVGELKKKIRPVGVATSSIYKKESTDTFDYSVIYDFNKDVALSSQNATLVMKFPGKYESTDIDLYKAYTQYGITLTGSYDIYSIKNSSLKMPFKTKYGKILLQSIGYVDGKLILAVDASDYYEIPNLYLLDKRTGRTYTRNDGLLSAEREGLQIYPFDIENINMLKELEIVMPEEYHFSFPLTFTDKTKIYSMSNKDIVVGNTKIEKIKISPLSLTIYGTAPSGSSPDFQYSDCSLKLKDNTVFDTFIFDSSNRDDEGRLYIYTQFKAPLEVDAVDSLSIKPVYADKAVEIPLQRSQGWH